MVELNGTLLIQILNFIILVAILGHFAYKPMMKVMEDRKNRIQNDLDSAKASKEAAESLKVEYEKQLKAAQIEAQDIVSKAVKKHKRLHRYKLMRLMLLSKVKRKMLLVKSKENARMLLRI